MNKFRLLRVSITDERSDANYDIVWEDCNADMVIHARDAIQVLYVLSAQIPFAFFRIRTRLAWIPPSCACAAFSSILSAGR